MTAAAPASGGERIYRLHPEHEFVLDPSRLLHLCAALARPLDGGLEFRDVLDPCAIGCCRYCGEPLP